jgi:hypothetical protein
LFPLLKPSFDICTSIPEIKFDENEAYANILYQNSISKSRLTLFITTQNDLKSTLPEGKNNFLPPIKATAHHTGYKGLFVYALNYLTIIKYWTIFLKRNS